MNSTNHLKFANVATESADA